MEERRVLMIVQNLPVPFDRRVWQEATTLAKNGYVVSVICPKGRGYEASYESLEGVHIYRHPLPFEASGALGYLIEYSLSLFWEFLLAWKVLFPQGFDVIHACNPPDNIFLIGGFFKYLFGKKFLFDHHDICPELYEAKFHRKDFFYKMMLWSERLTFMLADVSIATNKSYRQIAITRGRMPPNKVFIVRSGPDLERITITPHVLGLKMGKEHLVAYMGVMGPQDGVQNLIEAARIIVHDMNRRDIHFILTGDGPAFAKLKRSVEEYDLQHYVSFTGRLTGQPLLDVLNTADVCVSPDEVNAMSDQSTMNKVMDYMAVGKPIVQFELNEGRYSAGEAALYAKPNDTMDMARKIVELVDSPAKRHIMGRLGRTRIEKELAWVFEVPKLLAAYDAVFSPAGKK